MTTKKMSAIDEVIAQRRVRAAKYPGMVRETARLLGDVHPKKHGAWHRFNHTTKKGDTIYISWDDYAPNMHVLWKGRSEENAAKVFNVHNGNLDSYIPGPWEHVLLGLYRDRVAPLIAEEKVEGVTSAEREAMEKWGITEAEIKVTLAERV